jgi:hypothetical protein
MSLESWKAGNWQPHFSAFLFFLWQRTYIVQFITKFDEIETIRTIDERE